MEVFVAGATGVLGRRIVTKLSDNGHTVVGLHREGNADIVAANGGDPYRGDVLDRGSLEDRIAGCDAVVNVATAIPTATKPTATAWERNDRVRRTGTQNLFQIADDAGVDHFLQESVVWVARRPDGTFFGEDAPLNPDRTTESAADTEQFITNAAANGAMDVTILRSGWLYAPDSAQLQLIGEGLLDGLMPIIGGGLFGRRDATFSIIHADDAAAAYVDALETETTGRWHIVDDRPVTVAEFYRTFADELDAKRPRRFPGWIARFVVGSETARFFTSSMPTSSEPFEAETGWEPSYRTYEEGLRAVVETWESDGYPFETT